MWCLVKDETTLCTCKNIYNKFDWPIVIMGVHGLLLVLPHLFVVPISILWVELPQKEKKNLDVKIFFVRPYIEHCWKCFNMCYFLDPKHFHNVFSTSFFSKNTIRWTSATPPHPCLRMNNPLIQKRTFLFKTPNCFVA